MQFRQKLRSLIGVAMHAQNMAEQTKALASRFMARDEKEGSDVCRMVENLSCVCDELLEVIYDELKKEGL